MLLARQVTCPLQAMESRMQAVASGQLRRLTLDSPKSEFVTLAAAFNHVLDELERRQHTGGELNISAHAGVVDLNLADSGLDLFITFEIIKVHGGCISVANRPEGGAGFHIQLPSA